jgi:hypothetical protein
VSVDSEEGNQWPPMGSDSRGGVGSTLRPAPFVFLAMENNCRQALLGRWLK